MAAFIDALETEYTLIYELNGGEFPSGTTVPGIYTVNSDTVILPTPVKTDCSFAGWFDNADFSGDAVTSIPAGSAGNRIYYAKWLDISGTNIASVSVSGYPGKRAEGLDKFTVQLPARVPLPTTPSSLSITLEDPEATCGRACVYYDRQLPDMEVTVTARDNTTTEIYHRSYQFS